MNPEEGGKSEVRRIQITGGSTYIVSLPKKWVTQHDLKARDEVRIEWRPSGSLRLSAETTTVRKRRRVDIELDEIGSEFLFDHLIGAYLSGADRIRLSSRKAIKRSDRRIIRRFIQATRGIEISHETDFIVEMIALLNTSEMPLHSSINRMYLIVSRICPTCLSNNNLRASISFSLSSLSLSSDLSPPESTSDTSLI